MSEHVPERGPAPEEPRTGSPAPSAYGGHGTFASRPGPDAGPASPPPVPAATHYGPVPRHGHPRHEPPSSPTAVAAGGPLTASGWPPPAGSGLGPATSTTSPPLPYPWPAAGPSVGWGPPAAWGPPTDWGPGGPWSPPPRDDYASWFRRVAGWAVDAVPGWVASGFFYAAYVPVYVGLFRGDFGVLPDTTLVAVATLLSVAAFGWGIYNRYFLAGRTGQSVGKRVAKTWLVGRGTGRPIGPLNAFVRDLLHTLDGLSYVGYLWPLWDDERQTLADKIAQTVVVRTPVPPLSELERRQP